ncbi:nickel pincer cofactor biosynthesis protein LarB [Verrucomicrobium sp. BvORR034]|uniref:nickel pincer cofactor biosynthesis protein LarB n=1 Tax=Verrucomicrobium sp. BvORR034 TaxID=1396418 RepID=UPI00067999F4|nr:nickel pincer cofactor biosynthesis protein LarB [Verrucomicrobium sp. BvORR034]
MSNGWNIEELLQGVAAGRVGIEEATERLRSLPFSESPGLSLDTHRVLRLGLPEVVYGRHKNEAQIRAALEGLVAAHGCALATWVSEAHAAGLLSVFPDGEYDPTSRLFQIGRMPVPAAVKTVAVVCAGTSDLSVAEEAARTVEFAGHHALRVHDVGVAGLHRLLARLDDLKTAQVIIAVAGMEGALPSVLAGLVRPPVIAVPTSVGYGTNLGGLTALMAMLTSCSTGIGVVNVDNGFGAAMLALRIVQGD